MQNVFPYHHMRNGSGEFLMGRKMFMNTSGNIVFAE
jgi:hypothetical protein